MIVFDEVVLQYQYDEFQLLKGASFTLDNDVNTILCDTQSGKTSICRLLCKDIERTGGKILIDENSIDSITSQDLGILYLPSKPTFFERRSILQNVEYPLGVRKVSKANRRVEANKILQASGLQDVNRKVRTLDDDTRKKVALARGLTVPRKIVLFDDYFEDANEIDITLGLFGKHAIKIIVTSNVTFARGKTVVLDGGKTVYQGDASGAAKCVDELSWLIDRIN